MVQFTDLTGRTFLDENGRTQVPFRVVLEAFGANVAWNQTERTAIAQKNGIRVEAPIGENYIILNWEKVENDTVAVIVESKTYLPIRKVMEAFGANVSWDNKIQTVSITRPKPKEELSKEIQETIKIFEEKVIFDNDISLFTLYAFMNFTGYNDENNHKGFHEVRTMVRSDLGNMSLSLRDNNYYTNKKVDSRYYRQAFAMMNGAPNFQISGRLPNYLSQLNDLEIHLREFYEKANIEELFEKYNSYHQKELEKYSESIYPALAKTNHLLRVKDNEIPEFYLHVSLLEAYWRGYGLGTSYKHKGGKGIIIGGPSYEPNTALVVHEYLHGFILTEYFDKRFNEFEDYEGTLKEFIRMLISDIKAEIG